MNIILLIIDTLRYDYIAAHAARRVHTPHFDRLVERSWRFDYSFCASFPTIPHRTDVITARTGAPFHPWKPLDVDRPSLPGVLADAGYATQLIHDTPHLVNGAHGFDFPFHAWTFVRGAEVDRPWIDDSLDYLDNWAPDPLFDHLDPKAGYRYNPTITYIRANRGRRRDEDWNCAKLFLTASEFLRANARRDNFFLWVDCFDPHEPWDAPPEYMKMYDSTPGYDGRIDPRSFTARGAEGLSDAAIRRIQAAYAAKVSWVDRWLGVFLDALEETGLASRTAVVLTADHGTNVGERGKFGKGFPVREQEAHTPFLVCAPDAGAGRNDSFVQPQDVFATIAGLAGAAMPPGVEAYDLLQCAQAGRTSPRRCALAGAAASRKWAQPGAILFTVFDREFYLEYAAKPEHCRLTRLGELEDVAAQHPDRVAELRALGREEIARRGLDPKLVAWLESEGEAEFPSDARFTDVPPAPPGWRAYFSRLYHDPIDDAES